MPLQKIFSVSLNGLSGRIAIAATVLCSLHLLVMLVHFQFIEIPWLIRSLFDLDEEQSFGTWFSSLILLLAAILLLLHAQYLQKEGQPKTLPWWCLGVGFCILSMDEVVGLHETLNTAIDISWAVPAAILVLVIGFMYIPFLLRLPRSTLWRFLLSGTLYVGGAIGIEYLTEPYYEQGLLNTLSYNLTTLMEEGMEMFGVVLFIRALLQLIESDGIHSDIEIEITR